MNTNILITALDCFCAEEISVSYICPTFDNLPAGNYDSEIVDVKDVNDSKGNLVSLDFYHRLESSTSKTYYVRFRYYPKELPKLALDLKKYAHVKTWGDAVGLLEVVAVSKKENSKYMFIADRKASIATNTPMSIEEKVGDAEASAPPNKKGGLLTSKHRRAGTLPLAKRKDLLEDDDSEFDDFLEDDE